jgi:hypothetical protein
MHVAGNEARWQWTIYVGVYVKRAVDGVPIAGHSETLEQAKAQFRKSFDAMIVAGVVKIP